MVGIYVKHILYMFVMVLEARYFMLGNTPCVWYQNKPEMGLSGVTSLRLAFDPPLFVIRYLFN